MRSLNDVLEACLILFRCPLAHHAATCTSKLVECTFQERPQAHRGHLLLLFGEDVFEAGLLGAEQDQPGMAKSHED